jgi:hypothetical protein
MMQPAGPEPRDGAGEGVTAAAFGVLRREPFGHGYHSPGYGK